MTEFDIEFKDETWSGNFFTRQLEQRGEMLTILSERHHATVTGTPAGIEVVITAAGAPHPRLIEHRVMDVVFHVALDWAHERVFELDRACTRCPVLKRRNGDHRCGSCGEMI